MRIGAQIELEELSPERRRYEVEIVDQEKGDSPKEFLADRLDESAQPRDKRVRARVVCITVRGAFDRAWMHSHTKDLLADLRGEDEHDNRKLATNLLAFIDSGNEEACHDLDDADYDA